MWDFQLNILSILFGCLLCLFFLFIIPAVLRICRKRTNKSVYVNQFVEEYQLSDIWQGKPHPDGAYISEFARLSEYIYLEDEEIKAKLKSTDSRWKLVDLHSEAQLFEQVDEDMVVRIFYKARKNKARGSVAIVYRGTESKKWSILANAYWLLKFVGKKGQYGIVKSQIPVLIRTIKATPEYKDCRIISAGHSLGGGLAQFTCYLCPEIVNAYSYNGSPVTGWASVSVDERDANVKNSVICRINESGEILGFLRAVMKLTYRFNPLPNQHPKFIEYNVNFSGLNPLKQHSMKDLADKLQPQFYENTTQ